MALTVALLNHPAAALATALARRPEAVCRRYLPHGRRQGRYWVAGDLHGAKGRSLFVRLRPPGPPGKWTDAATGEHGDLLDLIGHRIGAGSLGPVIDEARAFLALPAPERNDPEAARAHPPASWDGAAAARRLWRSCRPLRATHADAYLRARGLDASRFPALRFHPALAYRDDAGRRRRFPALVAAVTNARGALEGVQRTWLDPSRPAKAPLAHPRKALGRIHGHAVRFAMPTRDAATLLVGEGIETVLSLVAAPALPAAAALSAGSLAAFVPPPAPPASSSPPTATPRAGAPRPRSKPGRSPRDSPPPSSPPSTATSTTTSPPSDRRRWPRGSPRSSAPDRERPRRPPGARRPHLARRSRRTRRRYGPSPKRRRTPRPTTVPCAHRGAASAIIGPCASSTPKGRCARTTTTPSRRWTGWTSTSCWP